MLTESEAWRTIGEAFEAKVVHPELFSVDYWSDLAGDGFCEGLIRLKEKEQLDEPTHDMMRPAIRAAIDASGGAGYIHPMPEETGGPEVRAMFAYLMAEVTA